MASSEIDEIDRRALDEWNRCLKYLEDYPKDEYGIVIHRYTLRELIRIRVHLAELMKSVGPASGG